MRSSTFLLGTLCVLACGLGAAATAERDATIASAVADPGRSQKFISRDSVRHPVEELTFFGLKPSMTVVELAPGGGYWTEILGPYLKASGHYYRGCGKWRK
jgi:predicted methyltransferase